MAIEFRLWPTADENRTRGAAASKAFGGALVLLALLFAVPLVLVAIFGAPRENQPHHLGAGALLIFLSFVAAVGALFWISGRAAEVKARRQSRLQNDPPAV
jgi:hypothetical protein